MPGGVVGRRDLTMMYAFLGLPLALMWLLSFTERLERWVGSTPPKRH
jgi:ABC-type spermidine/putrescine transport system permease subunit II